MERKEVYKALGAEDLLEEDEKKDSAPADDAEADPEKSDSPDETKSE